MPRTTTYLPWMGAFALFLLACRPAAAPEGDEPALEPDAGWADPDAGEPSAASPGERPPAEEPTVELGAADHASSSSSEPMEPSTVLLIPGTTIDGWFYDVMAERLRDDGFDPVVFVPPDKFTESLALGAARIGDEVERVRRERGEDRVHIVAECNGGVATRYYLQRLGGHEAVDEVITFVSAHQGTWSSPIGYWTTGFESLRDIKPGSTFLRELEAAPFPEELSLTSIYTCWDELLWPYDTSVVEGARNVLFCDHYLGHFDGFWDEVVYEHILETLRGRGDELPTSY